MLYDPVLFNLTCGTSWGKMTLVKEPKGRLYSGGLVQWGFVLGERDWIQPQIQENMRIYSQGAECVGSGVRRGG